MGNQCRFCDKPAVESIAMGDTFVCAEHFVGNFDEQYFLEVLKGQIQSAGKIVECEAVQVVIKERFPEFYRDCKHAINV